MKLRTEMILHCSVEDLRILGFDNTAILSKNLCIWLLILGILHRLQLEQCSASRIILNSKQNILESIIMFNRILINVNSHHAVHHVSACFFKPTSRIDTAKLQQTGSLGTAPLTTSRLFL